MKGSVFRSVDGFQLFGCADASSVRATLEKHGVAVVRGVLSEQECQEMLSGAWDFVEKLSEKFPDGQKLKRDDESTWRAFSKLFPSHGQLLQHFGIGHAEFLWKIRENPKILHVFECIWNTNDLLVSFDGASLCLKPEVTNLG